MNTKKIFLLLFLCVLFYTGWLYGQDKPVILKPHAKITFKALKECSGLAKSRLWDGVFWTHNDSGDKARIFAIDAEGNIIKPSWTKNYDGILIPEAVNIDWEAIAADDDGNLIIGDIGNNYNLRRDLAVYFAAEPFPRETLTSGIISKITFHYPDQKTFPPDRMNFDAESLFYSDGKLYLLTKHRSDTHTKLYRFDSMKQGISNPLTYISEFDAGSMVTDADISADGKKLAVLSYDFIWLFEKPENADDYFKGKKFRLRIKAGKAEGIAFDNDFLIITSEERDIFKVSITSLLSVP